MRFDAVLVLGKELRRDPVRGALELRARAAAASAVVRAGVPVVVALEARLRGQATAGSALVADLLHEFGVPGEAMLVQSVTHSTREEALVAFDVCRDQGWSRILAITAAYHVPRARRCLEDVMGRAGVAVHTPEAALQVASPRERSAILEARVSPATMAAEARTESALQACANLVRPLPASLRWAIEIQAGRLFRAP